MNFIGREKELRALENQFESGQFELSVIYGRRRIGKTRLIREFIEGKDAIYFLAVEAGETLNLRLLSQAIYRLTNPERSLPPFQDFEQAFRYLGEAAKDKRIIFVIDEFPYLAAASQGVASVLQAAIDQYLRDTQLFIILCGSSMSFMENQVLGAKSPLYGRRTAQYALMPFTFFETRQYLERMPVEDIAIAYGMTGGVAEYLSFIRQSESLEENIIRLFLNPDGRLFEEPANLLKQELREPKIYNSVLGAVANGATRSNEIAQATGISGNALNRYIQSLMELKILVREKPLGDNSPRKSIYRVRDGMFRFWYKFVQPNLNNLMLGLSKEVFRNLIQPEFSAYMGEVFEAIMLDYFDARQVVETLPFFVSQRGRWWGNNPVKKREEEIDLVAIGKGGILFGEAKWHNKPVDSDVIRELMEKSVIFKEEPKYYMLFSRKGFTENAKNLAASHSRIELVSYHEMAEFSPSV